MKRLTDKEELETYLGDSPHQPPTSPQRDTPRSSGTESVVNIRAEHLHTPRSRALSRVLAALILGFIAGLGVYGMEAHRHAMGKDVFLASQSQLWDRRYAETHAGVVVGIILAVGAGAGLYELLAFGIQKALTSNRGSALA